MSASTRVSRASRGGSSRKRKTLPDVPMVEHAAKKAATQCHPMWSSDEMVVESVRQRQKADVTSASVELKLVTSGVVVDKLVERDNAVGQLNNVYDVIATTSI